MPEKPERDGDKKKLQVFLSPAARGAGMPERYTARYITEKARQRERERETRTLDKEGACYIAVRTYYIYIYIYCGVNAAVILMPEREGRFFFVGHQRDFHFRRHRRRIM